MIGPSADVLWYHTCNHRACGVARCIREAFEQEFGVEGLGLPV